MSNSGVFDVNDIRYLMDYQQWAKPGELQLIQTQSASNSAALDFLAIKEDIYNVHFMTITNFQPVDDNHYIAYRLYESGTLETASVYQQARQYGIANGTFGESRSTGVDEVTVSHATGANDQETANCYIYFYDLGDSTKYSFSTSHSSGMQDTGLFNFEFASAVLPQTSQVDGIRILTDQGSNMQHAEVSLYGIRYS
tara:strand:+ start:161 stop:751 length:591 start_codon:yes stop_codon:yes gene_type:complete